MAEIILTQGKVAIVDDNLCDWLNRWKWYFKQGYACRNEYQPKHRTIRMHVMINQTPPGMDTDHINGDKLDNRWENLRTCTRSNNARNGKVRSTNTSGYKGIYWHKRDKAWRVQLMSGGKKKFIGNYRNIEAAIKARDTAYLTHHGDYAKY